MLLHPHLLLAVFIHKPLSSYIHFVLYIQYVPLHPFCIHHIYQPFDCLSISLFMLVAFFCKWHWIFDWYINHREKWTWLKTTFNGIMEIFLSSVLDKRLVQVTWHWWLYPMMMTECTLAWSKMKHSNMWPLVYASTLHSHDLQIVSENFSGQWIHLIFEPSNL